MKGGRKSDNFGGLFSVDFHQPLIHKLVRTLFAVMSIEIGCLSTSYSEVIQKVFSSYIIFLESV